MLAFNALVASIALFQAQGQVGDSLTIGAALRLARDRSPTIEVSEADVRRADAELDAARAERGPSLATELLYLRYQNPPELPLGTSVGFAPFLSNNFAALLRARQPIYTGGRVRAATRAAEAVREANGSVATSAAAELDAAVAEAFDDVLLARALRLVATEGVQVLEEAVRVATDQLDEGAVARIDVLRAETRLASARTDERQARDRVADAGERLAAVIGVDATALPRVAGTLEPPDSLDVGDLLSMSSEVGEGPRLDALRATARAREAEAAAARAALKPAVTVELGLLTTRPELVTGRKEWGEELFAGVGVSWTFFDFGRSSAKARASLTQVEGLSAVESAVRDSLEASFDVQSRRLKRAIADVAEARANVGRAGNVLDLARERYREGVGIQLEVLEAQADLVRVRGDLERAIHAALVSRIELRRILGRPAIEYGPNEGGDR